MIRVDWGNLEETLIIWKFAYDWDTVDFQHAITRTQLMLQSTSAIIHVMLDAQRIYAAHPDMICPIYDFVMNTSPQVARIVFISHDNSWRVWWRNLIAPEYAYIHNRMFFVTSANDAYHLVEDVLM